MTGVIAIMAGMAGASGETKVVTVGQASDGFSFLRRGFSSILSLGSIDNNSFNLKGGAPILQVLYDVDLIGATTQVVFTLGGTLTNDGWTNMHIGSTDFARTSASFAAGANTTWTWVGASDPFGATGAGTTVVFT